MLPPIFILHQAKSLPDVGGNGMAPRPSLYNRKQNYTRWGKAPLWVILFPTFYEGKGGPSVVNAPSLQQNLVTPLAAGDSVLPSPPVALLCPSGPPVAV